MIGTNIINKCEVNGQVTFTNDACPEGAVAQLSPAEATAVDLNGVSSPIDSQAFTAHAVELTPPQQPKPTSSAATKAYGVVSLPQPRMGKQRQLSW